MFWWLFACAPISPPCGPAIADAAPPTDVTALAATLADARAAMPELDDLQISLEPMTAESDFFTASLDLATLEAPPRNRAYRINYNERLFDAPPPRPAVGGILVHELKHLWDYAALESDALAAFALEYAQGPIAEYERETDYFALERGCGVGLIAYREWLYARLPPEAVAEKRRDYLTPEEIRAWLEQNR